MYKCYEASPSKFPKNATFADFHNAKCKDIIVFASDLNTHNICEFSYYKTPNCIVAEAIRASMSIPFFFKSWQFSNKIPNDHIYVDGGVMFNYPLSFFDKPRFHDNPIEYHQESLGLFLEPKKIYEMNENIESNEDLTTEKLHGFKKRVYEIKFKYGMWIFAYIKHLFESLMNSQDIDLFEESHLVDRTIFIDDLGISATNFNLTDQQKTDLVNSGSAGALKYFEYLKKKQAITQPS
ncbi:MAG: patatin-like phospholipase family protein [Olleya sp.]